MFRTFFTLGLLLVAMPLRAVGPDPAALAEVDHIFAQWQLDAHVPGLVYGVFADGKLVHVKARGVQELDRRKPVDSDEYVRQLWTYDGDSDKNANRWENGQIGTGLGADRLCTSLYRRPEAGAPA